MERADLRNIEELWKIERECFTREAYTKEQIEILLRNPNVVGWLARINGEAAGFIMGMIESHGMTKAGHVYTIDVSIKHRRRGVGLRLLSEIEKTFLKGGAEASYLEVRVDNQAARTLYRKHGYAEAETLDDYYTGGVHGLRLVKRLKAKQSVGAS